MRGQAPPSERGWEPADGLAGGQITLVVEHGDDLARSEEDFGRRRIGIGAIWMDCEKEVGASRGS